ncbi:MAG: hypothetical protein NTV88_05230 [Candidatus Micrarchaeota archaeon]|nr:hypothetical protein [Candidatus Micrarchaeota archaeon]
MGFGIPNRIALLLLTLLAAAPSLLNASGMVCNPATFNDTLSFSAMAAIGTIAIIAVCYMFGEFFQNARMLTWSKTEILQVFMSLIIVLVILQIMSSFCSFRIDEISSIFISSHPPAIYANFGSETMYDAASIYLENLMAITSTNMQSLRYSLGAYEIRTTYTTYNCNMACFLSLVGSNEAPHSGESMQLALTNNLLSTATIAYLSAVFQYFTLQYIQSGVFILFLPIAIVIRSAPFMRQFGGALIAIFLSLYIMYPIMMIFNASIASGMAGTGTSPAIKIYHYPGCPGENLFKQVGGSAGVDCKTTDGTYNYDEEDLSLSFGQLLTGSMPDPAPFTEQARSSALIFLVAVFLPAVDFLVIAAMARGISHMLGEEVDISRLGQMV